MSTYASRRLAPSGRQNARLTVSLVGLTAKEPCRGLLSGPQGYRSACRPPREGKGRRSIAAAPAEPDRRAVIPTICPFSAVLGGQWQTCQGGVDRWRRREPRSRRWLWTSRGPARLQPVPGHVATGISSALGIAMKAASYAQYGGIWKARAEAVVTSNRNAVVRLRWSLPAAD